MSSEKAFKTVEHDVDVCVVGGGMAGVCAAIAAARHGARTILMQDRPVLGGNASSECRVHICGAGRHASIPNMRETGILEELRMENLARNPHRVWDIWDTVLYEKTHYQDNLTLLLNCSCMDAEMSDESIVSVTGWQLTTQTYHQVTADVFADCSGDAVLAPLTGAKFRVGREASDEYGESIAPEEADDCTMGMSLLFWARECDTPQRFDPPEWAYTFENCDDLPYGADGHQSIREGYWWVELGGTEDYDTIEDTEELRDELLRISYGVWDHIKNHCDVDSENWTLERMPFLPAKRESRRYIGDHVLTQNDVEAGGRFEDTVAYGGWTMDDHHPTGFWSGQLGYPPTVFHEAPSPYGIPYRCLYSRNIDNLMFAGRCASMTHAAMSSARVMGTGAVMGQAVGTAASIATDSGGTPRDVFQEYIHQLQQALLADDCYLPQVERNLPDLTLLADICASQGDPEPVRDGIARPVGSKLHGWKCRPGDSVEYLFEAQEQIEQVDLTLESGLDELICMCPKDDDRLDSTPDDMPEDFRIEVRHGQTWETVVKVSDNIHRHVRLPIDESGTGVRFVLESTRGAPESCVYRFEVK